jgi:TetR/AcrR family transcriptional regulator, lmrAB and yxaGH operons repressor
MTLTKGERTRTRMAHAAADRMHRQGYHATGVNQILSDAGAPRGSLYFHFPGGKEELAADAVTLAAGSLDAWIAELMAAAPDAVAAVRSVIEMLATQLVDSSYEKGCPVATVSLELTGEHEQLQQACASAYTSWEQTLAERLRADGFTESAAREYATLLLAAIEGALLLARAYRSPHPLQRLAATVSTLLAGAT